MCIRDRDTATQGAFTPRHGTVIAITQKELKRLQKAFPNTKVGADGRFNNNLVTALMEDRRLQERLIWELGRTMTEKGYRGLDIDFEYVRAEDGPAFAEFTSRVRRVLQVFGYPVSVALAPKKSPDQKGLLYEGIDYRLLGEAADRVMLMTYEWGYTYEQNDLW